MHSLSRSSRFWCSDTKGPTFSCWKPDICYHNRFCCCERVRIIFLILFFTMVGQHKLLQVLTGEKPGYKSPSVRILLPLKCTISKEGKSTSLMFQCAVVEILMKQLVINFVSAVDCHNVQFNVIPLRMAHRIRTGLLVNSICCWKRINTQYVTIHNIPFTFECF